MQFYFIEGIVDLAEELSRDKQALERLHMHRTTASYKMTLRKRWKVTLEQIEEAINNNQTRLLTILVSYYNEQSQLVIVEHLASLSVLAVNASSVFHAVKNEYEDLELPWKNVMSILMNSWNDMRGSKSRFETKVRENLPSQLLDIDRDSCHYMHNIAQCFTKTFKNVLESYLAIFTLIFLQQWLSWCIGWYLRYLILKVH